MLILNRKATKDKALDFHLGEQNEESSNIEITTNINKSRPEFCNGSSTLPSLAI